MFNQILQLASGMKTVLLNANLSFVCTTVRYSFVLLLLYAQLHGCLYWMARNLQYLIIILIGV